MKDKHDVGVIVGRFQVHKLHPEHIRLIDEVCDKHDKVIIFLGTSPVLATQENPLDFQARKQMLLEEFPAADLNVLYIKDMSDDAIWSKMLDEKIQDLVSPSQTPILYGGRDSFIDRYKGIFPTEELEPETYVQFSGSDMRRAVAKMSTKASPDFRAGVVWAAFNRYAVPYPTVDIAIFNNDLKRMLLGKKLHEDHWRLIGGFAMPDSESFEQDARREVFEEANIEITDPKYIGSFKVDDWRYRSEQDKIKTSLYIAQFQSGSLKPGDDIAQLRWFELDDLIPPNQVVRNHWPLVLAAIDARNGVLF